MHGYALAGKVSQMEQVVAKVRRLMPEQSIDTYGIRMEGYRFHGQYAMYAICSLCSMHVHKHHTGSSGLLHS